jgi:hypothetical protein
MLRTLLHRTGVLRSGVLRSAGLATTVARRTISSSTLHTRSVYPLLTATTTTRSWPRHASSLMQQRLAIGVRRFTEDNSAAGSEASRPPKALKTMMAMFTCNRCQTRDQYAFSRDSYQKGIVIVRCSGCKNLHLIAGMSESPIRGTAVAVVAVAAALYTL